MEFAIDNAIFLFSVLLIVGVIMAKFSDRLGLPALIFFIAVGMVLGRFIYYDNASLTQFFGIFALTVILFEGGLSTKWADMRPILKPSLSLAVFGVVITAMVVGVFAKLILGVTWTEGMLFGAIVGSTDAAAVFAVLRNKDIKRKLTATLEMESGSNDPMAVFLTVSLIAIIQSPEANFLTMTGDFFVQMGLGLVFGLLFGRLGIWSINKINLDSSGLYPALSLGFAVLTYSLTAIIGGSGFLAVYVAGILMGNQDLTYRHSIFRFNEGLAWMMQILMFILLGLLVFPQQLYSVVWQGLALSVLLMFIARPIAVYLCTPFMNFSFKEKLFLSWAGLKGAVPIILATFPLIANLEIGQLFFNVVFFVVFTSTLIQGWTISPLASVLGFAEPKRQTAPHSLELVSIGKTNSEMIEIDIEESSRVTGKRLHELDLPNNTLVTAVIRGEKLITPHGNTKLLAGDILYVLVSKAQRENVKKIFLHPPEEEADGAVESIKISTEEDINQETQKEENEKEERTEEEKKEKENEMTIKEEEGLVKKKEESAEEEDGAVKGKKEATNSEEGKITQREKEEESKNEEKEREKVK